MGKAVYLAKITSEKLKSLLKGFEKHLKETDRGSSARVYLGAVQAYASWMAGRYGSFNVQAVSPLDLVQYRQELQDMGRAPATINRILVTMKVFFDWAREQGYVQDNPVQGIKQVAMVAPAPGWLTRNQQATLDRAVRKDGSARDKAIIGLMIHAGLRVGELCELKREDIHISERAGRVVVRKGKGNKYREVPLNKTIRKILQDWLEENKSGVLFPNKRRSAIGTRGVYNLVADYAYRAKLDDVTPHTLRHTFCKNAIDAGISIDRVALMAGHSTLDITKRYTIPSMGDLQADVERLAWE